MPVYMPEENARELPPAGPHTAVCNLVVDCGTQDTGFGPKRLVFIGWELHDERASDGKPFQIGRRYNYSAHAQSSLRGDIEGWLGRPLARDEFGKLDLGTFLGRTCTLGIKHDTTERGTFANIGSVMKPAKGTPDRLPLGAPGVALSLDERPFDYVSYDQLPGWLRDTIARSPEYARATNPNQPAPSLPQREFAATRDMLDDDIPFD